MGFVFQQNFLFAGTIAENVKSARPEATDEEIRQAFRDLDCLDLIEDLPAGIHTPCSEKGRGLSMGQQQLVAFARAAADPTIVSFIEGIELTERAFLSSLGRQGVKKIDPQGQRFDPNMHEALFEAPDTSVPNGTVVQVVETGYSIGERCLRPAKVGVSRGGPKAVQA
jgi:hypothetical protein